MFCNMFIFNLLQIKIFENFHYHFLPLWLPHTFNHYRLASGMVFFDKINAKNKASVF